MHLLLRATLLDSLPKSGCLCQNVDLRQLINEIYADRITLAGAINMILAIILLANRKIWLEKIHRLVDVNILCPRPKFPFWLHLMVYTPAYDIEQDKEQSG